MEDGKRGKSNVERQAIDEDILFLASMKTDRIAFYIGKDQHTAKAEESRKVRQQKRENSLKKARLQKPEHALQKELSSSDVR